MKTLTPYLAPCLAFLVTTTLLLLIMRKGWLRFVLDLPNHRSLHASPIPRVGGVAVLAGVFAGWPLVGMDHLSVLMPLLALIFLVSLSDDIFELPIGWRFLSHGMATGLFLWLMTPLDAWSAAGIGIAMVWMINLYNFMDGSDGLAGGMACIGFGFLAIAAINAGDMRFAMLCLSVSASAAAFLIFNFHPAKIFLGDSGSIPLGFLSGGLGLLGVQRGHWPLWFPLIVFSPFIVDATVTLLRRLLRGDKIWQPHREHFYQRLILSGFGHRNTALAEYVLMLICGLLGLWALAGGTGRRLVIAVLISALYVLAGVTVSKHVQRNDNVPRTSL